MPQQTSHCPLCQSAKVEFYWRDKRREYCQCQHCHLVFVPELFQLSAAEEKAEYDKHQNTILDEGYRRFLNRTLEPLLSVVHSRFEQSPLGLDFGCGEGAFLSKMAADQDVQINNYDLYYHPEETMLKIDYDFIVMTEVLEHLARPEGSLQLLLNRLKPGGILAIMTKRVRNQQAFTTWHYKNDPTHICFYSIDTFEFIAKHYNLNLEVVSDDVVFLFNK